MQACSRKDEPGMPKTGILKRVGGNNLKMKKITIIVFMLFVSITSFCKVSPVLEESKSSEIKITSQEPQKLSDVIKGINSSVLQSDNEQVVKNYLVSKNEEIKNYLVAKYPNRKYEEIITTESDFLFVGIVHAIAEENSFQNINPQDVLSMNTSKRVLPAWASCAWGVIAGILDIGGLYNEYVNLFNGGSSFGSIWRVLRKTMLRGAGWFVLAGAAWDIGTQCF